jgi:glucosylceramidase
VYLTTRDLKSTLARQPDLTFRAGTVSGADSVSVDPSVDYQTLTAGFGVAMTDTSAYELDTQLPAALRDEVMQKLFSPTGGIGLSFLRVPIGGSDYVVGNPYTYDDMPVGQVDPTLTHFSLAHDQPYIIPMIRQARVPQMRGTRARSKVVVSRALCPLPGFGSCVYRARRAGWPPWVGYSAALAAGVKS